MKWFVIYGNAEAEGGRFIAGGAATLDAVARQLCFKPDGDYEAAHPGRATVYFRVEGGRAFMRTGGSELLMSELD